MSMEKTIHVVCPQCAKENTVRVWESLNAAMDPEEKKALLEGNLNTYQCQGCGLRILVPVPFMYHDTDRRICVQFYPFDALRSPDFYQHFSPYGAVSRQVSRDLDLPEYMRNRHIVFDMGELVRYIVFREKIFSDWSEQE